MKIHFLGTGAAEGVPAPFCSCENCQNSRKKGGKNYRKRSSILINEDLLIDMGPDFSMACKEYRLDLSELKIICITHAHFDHFYPENLEIRSKRYIPYQPEKVYLIANSSVMYKLANLGYSADELAIERVNVKFGKYSNYSKYKIMPVYANHAHEYGDAANYLITDDKGVKILYASDTGIYDEETFKILEDQKLDILIMDCTNLLGKTSSSHLNLETFLKQLNRLKKINCVSNQTKVVATHFSHSVVSEAEELEKILSPYNIFPAYDNMIINL